MRQSCHLLRLSIAALIVASILALAATAVAQETPENYGDTIHVIQPKPVLQQGRLNLTPQLGMTINDAMHRNFKVGAQASYHFTERLFLGGLFEWYDFGGIIGGETQAYRDVNAATGATVDSPFLNWSAGGELGFVPLFGKFALFNRGIMFYDVAVTAGAAYTNSSSITNPLLNEGGVGGTISLSTRLFFNEWMAMNIEIRDVIYQGNVQGQSGVLSHSVTASAGMSFYFPTAFEYEAITLD